MNLQLLYVATDAAFSMPVSIEIRGVQLLIPDVGGEDEEL